MLSQLEGKLSPEARAAKAAFMAAKKQIREWLRECESGVELIERGYAEDVELAGDVGASQCAPILVEGTFQDINTG